MERDRRRSTLASAAAAGAAAGALALGLWLGGALDRWESTAWSWRVRILAAPSAHTDAIRLILLDQESLDWGQEVNGWSWPWPREVYTAILDFCRRGPAASIGFDVLLSEPSVYGVEDDAVLAAGMRARDDLVGAVFLHSDRRGSGPPRGTVRPGLPAAAVEGLGSWLETAEADPARDVTMPTPDLAAAPALLAMISDRPDPDGVFRRATLFRPLGERLVPSMGLGVLLVAASEPAPSPQDPDERVRGLAGQLSFRAGGMEAAGSLVRPDRSGRVLLRYRGPAGTHRSYGAAEILRSELLLREGGEPEIRPEELAGRHVLFGFSAPGLLDLRTTPLSRASPGVEIHATVLDNLLAGDVLAEAPALPVAAGTILLSLAAALLLARAAGTATRLAVGAGLLAVPAAAGLAGYVAGWWWPVVPGEIGALGGAAGGLLVGYASEGRRRRFLKRAFQHYLSPAVIERLLRDPDRLRLGGERRELTILFGDLAGFTGLSERLDPQTLTSLLNDYLSEMTEIVLDEGGTLDKYEGDALVAFWNAPLDQPDHAARACRAAVRCQERLAQLREEYGRRSGEELRLRIGLHTGEVIVGNLGSRQRFDYSVLGDAANLAARLEGANKSLGTGTLVSARTLEAARAAGGAELAGRALPLGSLRVVGRREPVEVFTLDGGGDPAVFAEAIRLCSEGRSLHAAAMLEDLPDPLARRLADRCRRDPGAGGIWELREK